MKTINTIIIFVVTMIITLCGLFYKYNNNIVSEKTNIIYSHVLNRYVEKIDNKELLKDINIILDKYEKK